MCGAITFRTAGELRDVINCHCVRCRRFTGHHLAATAVDTAELIIDDGQANLTWYSPVPEAAYAFCRTCGSSLFWRSATRPARTSICAGTLNLPTRLRTTQAWWVSQASDYHARPDLAEFQTE